MGIGVTTGQKIVQWSTTFLLGLLGLEIQCCRRNETIEAVEGGANNI